MFSDTPPAPSFQSILCKLQPLTRHSVRHLPYNIGVLPCVNLQLIYLKQLRAVAILHRVLPAFCAEHSRNVLEKRTGLPCFPMTLTVGKTHRLPPEQLHFTQGIPAPLPRRDPRTCWKTTQDRPVPRVAIYTGLAVFGLFELYAGCFPHRKMVVECTGCSWLNTQVCVVKLHRLYLLLI